MKLSPVALNQQSSCGGTVFDTLLKYGARGIFDDMTYLGSNIRALSRLSGVLIDHGAIITTDSAIRLPSCLDIPKYCYFKSSPNYLFLPTVIDDRGAEGIYD